VTFQLRALDAITSFSPTQEESVLVDRVFAVADPERSGTINPDVALSITMGSNLPENTLQEIWEIANVEENPALGKYCVGIALRLIGHVQNGAEVSEKLVSKGLAYAHILLSSKTLILV
jgi:epidermal growth factor receptor substrate 15